MSATTVKGRIYLLRSTVDPSVMLVNSTASSNNKTLKHILAAQRSRWRRYKQGKANKPYNIVRVMEVDGCDNISISLIEDKFYTSLSDLIGRGIEINNMVQSGLWSPDSGTTPPPHKKVKRLKELS